MKDAKSSTDEDQFFDAFDEIPFYDCPEDLESFHDAVPPPQSSISLSSASNSTPHRSSVTGGLRRRRLLGSKERKKEVFHDVRENVDPDRAEMGSMSVPDGVNLEKNVNPDEAEMGSMSVSDGVDVGKIVNTEGDELGLRSVSDGVIAEKNEISTVTAVAQNAEGSDSVRGNDQGQSSSLDPLAELVVKAIEFQFNMLIGLIMFPFRVIYYSFVLCFDPFYVLRIVRNCLNRKMMKLWKLVSDAVSPFVSGWIDEHKSLLKFGLRFGWGIMWSILVGSVLVSLLVFAFVISGVIVRYYLVEEPFQLDQQLNFDYTKNKPEAFVPIISCPDPNMECIDGRKLGSGGSVRVIPRGQKLRSTVTLVLPESDYNRNLGIFQVRVDFLSENGRSLGSITRPCMLEFRSEPIRLLLTFLKVIPLVAGYVSEAQTLRLYLRGHTEGVTATACLKVTIEQRAVFQAGGGIPEVYCAFIHVESDLPFFKRMLWYWRRTIFVWLGMFLFMVELVFALICYGAVMMPRARTADSATRSSNTQRSH